MRMEKLYMYKKYCNRCFHSSYSSCRVGEWLCPTCSHDLTNMKAIVASNQTELILNKNYQNLNDYKMRPKSKISFKI